MDPIAPGQVTAKKAVAFNHFGVQQIEGGFDTDNDVDGNDFLTWQRGIGGG